MPTGIPGTAAWALVVAITGQAGQEQLEPIEEFKTEAECRTAAEARKAAEKASCRKIVYIEIPK